MLSIAIRNAPFSFIVTISHSEPPTKELIGDVVGPNAAFMEVTDPTVVELDGIVDEIDVLLIQAGARATLTMDSLPGQVLDGTISEIAPAASNQQGVVTYPVRIQVNVLGVWSCVQG